MRDITALNGAPPGYVILVQNPGDGTIQVIMDSDTDCAVFHTDDEARAFISDSHLCRAWEHQIVPLQFSS